MAEYFLCPAGVQLRDEVNKMFPRRDKRSDGWIGDPSHQARKSEHNPCWSCSGRARGVVLAIDIDVDDGDPGRDLRRMLLNELIGDPRVWYVISNGVIYSRTNGWASKRYTGSNQHFGHLHVSFRIENAWDTRPFFGPSKPVRTKPYLLDVSKVRDAFRHAAVTGKPQYSIDVRRMQRLFNARLGTRLELDGLAGRATLEAAARFEKKYGGEGRPRVPDGAAIRKANQGMFKIVA